jgi:beta-galactosidase
MYFGVDYYPEQWVYPYAGTAEEPEAQWELDASLMVKAGFNVVRIGEFTWGLCEPAPGKYDFSWLQRVMDIMQRHGIQVVLATPTAAPPLWLTQQHPDILPITADGTVLHDGTRRACCLNSDLYWNAAKQIVQQMATALGKHPQLIAWQIDNALGGHATESSFNEASRMEWHNWLKLKYETIERLNDRLGLRHWGQVVTDWDQVPMPMKAPTDHNPALVSDWQRFSSDTIIAFVRMQAAALHELTPSIPVTTNLRPFANIYDHFDLAEALDFVSIRSTAAVKMKFSETACDLDMMRSLKKTGINTPEGDAGFWVMEQKAGQTSFQDVNALIRPGVLRKFTYQLISRGATGILYFLWRPSRIGTEKFHGAVLPHHLEGSQRIFKEISQIGEELKLLAPALKDTKVVADVCILYSHDNDWALQQPNQPNKHFSLRDHIQLIYNAFHDRNIPVDFARPSDDLFNYKLVVAPSLHMLSAGEADRLKLYVQNGGTLLGTFNTGLVNSSQTAPTTGYPGDLTELFGLEVLEFDMLQPNEENHLIFKGSFPTSHLHVAKLWCDIIEPMGCQILATYAKDFYAGKPAVTLNPYGLGKAIYIGTQSQQFFYQDLVLWLRQTCGIQSLLKVPDNIEVSMRQKAGMRVYILINHQSTPVRIQFYKPMHDFLTGSTFSGNYDMPPHGILVLDEQPDGKTSGAKA